MKQTVEKEAISFANKCRIANIKGGLDYPYDELDMRNAFEEGAKWQSKQSPWISAKERLPESNITVLTKGAYGYLICFLSNLGEWETGANINEERLGITHWMPIPSFDEILEANKDVLKRIKEKGD